MKSNEWLERRKTGIGGSDVAAVLGLSPWKSPLDVWMDKTGRRSEASEETEAMYWGNVLEDVVAREFARRRGVRVARRNKMFRHPEHPCLIANIDRRIVGGEILECKTSGWARDWGEDADEVPMHYLCQVAHYMCVLDAPAAWIAVLIGGNQYRDYRIQRSQRLEVAIVSRCAAFWQDHVLADIPPPPRSLSDVAALYKDGGREGDAIAPEDIERCVFELARYKSQINEIENSAAEAELRIKEAIADNAGLVAADGRPLATWKSSTVKRLNTKKLRAEMPEVAEKYTAETELRRFLLKVNTAKQDGE